MNNYSRDDLLGLIKETYEREGGTPSNTLYSILLNQAIREISRLSGGRYTSWTNTASGGLSLTNGIANLPTDLIRIESAFWDDIELPFRDIPSLDYHNEGWRTETGDPAYYATTGRTLQLDTLVTDSTSGDLVVYGYGHLPDFSATQNPLEYLAAADQMLPAYFVISRLPVTRVVPISEQPEMIRMADTEYQVRMATKQQYKDLWESGLPLAVESVTQRRGRPYDGR